MKSHNLREVGRLEGPLPLFNKFNSSRIPVLQHLFFVWQDPTAADVVEQKQQQQSPPPALLHIHIVILHSVKHFLWLGQIPAPTIAQLTTTTTSSSSSSSGGYSFAIHYGHHEEIFDRFSRASLDAVTSIPEDTFHFLSQLPTSRYLHCPSERTARWLERNNVSPNQRRVDVTEESLKGMKAMMAHLRMEFWVMCGSLLGWYRQCAPIPYTTDNDFSSWPRYLQGRTNITQLLRTTAPKYGMRLLYRFGDGPTRSLEYSFLTKYNRDKVDL